MKDLMNDQFQSLEMRLSKKRKEIDDKRNEFYKKYYAIKNGIKAASDKAATASDRSSSV